MEPEETKMPKNMDSCFIGLSSKSSLCHGTFYTSNIGLKMFQDLTTADQDLLLRRSNLTFEPESKICLHHEAQFLAKYESQQKICCNPFNKKNHIVRTTLQAINISTADKLTKITKKNIKPGQKVCQRCKGYFDKIKEEESTLTASSSSQPDPDFIVDESERVNTSLTALGVSPVKLGKRSRRDMHSYAKQKASQAQQAIVAKIEDVTSTNLEEIQPITSKQYDNCINSDFEHLMEELKQKLKVSDHCKKIQILTLAPKSWTISRTMAEFGVSKRMVNDARRLKAEEGILATPKKRQGKQLAKEVQLRVQMFFEDDEFSRICPGKKDCVSVRIDGTKVLKQKRLLLSNLKEMFISYRSTNGPEIGFSKFCELRPKWCVNVGSSGMHSVCICTIHQNVKLMLAATPIKEDYKKLIAKTVCSMEKKDCMLHRCQECPGIEGLAQFMDNIFHDSDPEEPVEFKQWIHTDRETLQTKQLPLEEFVEEFEKKIWNLCCHHFVAKHQSQHLKELKEFLKEGELIILMDFAENYSFVVQDAVQGFHWDNSQATLHPFVIYYRNNDGIQNLNFCVISDCLRHDTIAVNVFIHNLINNLKTKFYDIQHIHYFSDGSAAQYKNFKNFMNLCCHIKDFDITADWNFFGTSHGKSPCDGIGGTAKRLAARASLQRPFENQILTPEDLFKFCDETINGIKFVYISKEEIEAAKFAQEERFKHGNTVAGTRENHQFVPIDEKTIQVSRISNDSTFFTARVGEQYMEAFEGIKIANLQPGQYIACIYDNKWWVGNICETSAEHCDALINFMHPHGPSNCFSWPERCDTCWIPEQHILAKIPVPSVTSSGRQYHFPELIISSINEEFSHAR